MHKEIITCAANIYRVTNKEGVSTEVVIADAGHMCRVMKGVVDAFRLMGCEVVLCNEKEDRGQGFITNSSEYKTRSEAYTIAKGSGQPFNDEHTLPNNKLDSSCIRHFKEDGDWEEYLYWGCSCRENLYVFYEQRAEGKLYECIKCGDVKYDNGIEKYL